MKARVLLRRLAWAAPLYACLAFVPAVAAADAPAMVYVYADPQPHGVSYAYRIVNAESRAAVTALHIGAGAGLATEPLQIAAPEGWTGGIELGEEGNGFSVRWQAGGAGNAVHVEESLDGFELVLPRPDPVYATGRFGLELADGRRITGQVQAEAVE